MLGNAWAVELLGRLCTARYYGYIYWGSSDWPKPWKGPWGVSLLALRYMAWTRAGGLPPIPWDVGPAFKKRSLSFLLYCRNVNSCWQLSPERAICWPCCSWECQPVGTSCSSGCVEVWLMEYGVSLEYDREIQGGTWPLSQQNPKGWVVNRAGSRKVGFS